MTEEIAEIALTADQARDAADKLRAAAEPLSHEKTLLKVASLREADSLTEYADDVDVAE